MCAAAITALEAVPKDASLQTFFDNLDSFAEAPEGVAKLRELILDLAVRGKLVEQDENDEPASELLKRIAEEREVAVAEKRLRKSAPLPPVDKKVHTVPTDWEWERVGNVGLTQTGTTPSKSRSEFFGNDYPFLKPADLSPNGINYDNEGLSEVGAETGRLIEANSVLMVCIGGSIGKVSAIDRVCSCNQQINAFTPFAELDHCLVHYFMKSPFFQNEVLSRAPQTTLPILSKGKWDQLPLPIPPLPEQRRIVAKVDGLMSLCDELESRRDSRVKVRERASRSCLERLVSSRSRRDLRSAWRRLSDHFEVLYDTPETIADLRQSILQLAVQGKLVPQDPNDEPAESLHSRIQDERTQRQSDGVDKKTKPLPPIDEEERPFDLPPEWEWSRLRDLVYLLGDGLHGTPEYEKGTEFYFVNGNNLIDGRIVFKPNTKTVSREAMRQHAKRMTANTVLVSINGTLGNVAFYNDEQIVLGKSACYFNLSDFVGKHYVRFLLEGPYFMDYALANATGSTIKNLGLKAMNSFPVPLPPLAEQKRIVAKVDQLLSQCDELSAQLGERQVATQELLTASIHHVLDGKSHD